MRIGGLSLYKCINYKDNQVLVGVGSKKYTHNSDYSHRQLTMLHLDVFENVFFIIILLLFIHQTTHYAAPYAVSLFS